MNNHNSMQKLRDQDFILTDGVFESYIHQSPAGRSGYAVISTFRLRTFRRIDDLSVAAYDGSGCQARLVDMRWTQDVHHMIALTEQVIADDPPMTSPPDRLGAHDRTAVPGAQPLELGETAGKGRSERIIRIVSEAAYTPIVVRRRLSIPRLSSKPAKRGNMFVADLRRRQRFGEAFAIELRIGA